MKKILVTGASGFIGRSLCKTLIIKNKLVHGIVRNSSKVKKKNNIKYTSVGEINYDTNWTEVLSNVDCVIHCAGRAHLMNKNDKISYETYRSINVDGTVRLANQAAETGVRRIIFLSSIKVNGENTGEPMIGKINNNTNKNYFTHTDKPEPKDLYGISKLEAEKELWKISRKTGLEVNILRLPLVYGEGVKGNLNRLLMLVRSRMPLPFKMIRNQRSMIGLDNLIDLIILCIDHPAAAGKTFLVSDGENLSTPGLINHIAHSMGRSARLFPIPISLLKLAARIFNRKEEIKRLTDSLIIDSRFTNETLNWYPPYNVSEGIRRMVQSNINL